MLVFGPCVEVRQAQGATDLGPQRAAARCHAPTCASQRWHSSLPRTREEAGVGSAVAPRRAPGAACRHSEPPSVSWDTAGTAARCTPPGVQKSPSPSRAWPCAWAAARRHVAAVPRPAPSPDALRRGARATARGASDRCGSAPEGLDLFSSDANSVSPRRAVGPPTLPPSAPRRAPGLSAERPWGEAAARCRPSRPVGWPPASPAWWL